MVWVEQLVGESCRRGQRNLACRRLSDAVCRWRRRSGLDWVEIELDFAGTTLVEISDVGGGRHASHHSSGWTTCATACILYHTLPMTVSPAGGRRVRPGVWGVSGAGTESACKHGSRRQLAHRVLLLADGPRKRHSRPLVPSLAHRGGTRSCPPPYSHDFVAIIVLAQARWRYPPG